MTATKDEAYSHLQLLEKFLLSNGMPLGPDMSLEIRRIVTQAKGVQDRKHLKQPEAAFLNTYVIPGTVRYLREVCGLNEVQAREALLNEYHLSMPETSAASPMHPGRLPFRKHMLGLTAKEVYRGWLKPANADGLTQSAPDFALRSPFQHRILFEGKYFPRGSLDYARGQLAADLYQAFFYRGLAPMPAKKAGRPDWNYDYSCFLAFDASKDGTFRQAWLDLSPAIRKSFWDTANIYVMILRD